VGQRRRRAAARALARLGQPARAYELMLSFHSAQLSLSLRPLRPPRRGDGDGLSLYCAQVSCAVCDSLATAVSDLAAALPGENGRASALLAWAGAAVGRWAEALGQSGAPLGPEATLAQSSACCRVALAHCALLQPFGLALAPLLASLLRAAFSQKLEALLASGAPGPRLLGAAMLYLQGGSSTQLADVAQAVLLEQAEQEAGSG
jgi:hypothetical protein